MGVLSYGAGACGGGGEDGWARVSTYYSWIRTEACSRSTSIGCNIDCCGTATFKINVREGFQSGVQKAASFASGVSTFLLGSDSTGGHE